MDQYISPTFLRQLRTRNALYGYRGEPAANPFNLGTPEHSTLHQAYHAGNHRLCVRQSIIERAEAFVSGKKADRRGLIILAGCAAYILLAMVPQAIHQYLMGVPHP
jgi:hypothetical protein